jgi:hypothetical protein
MEMFKIVNSGNDTQVCITRFKAEEVYTCCILSVVGNSLIQAIVKCASQSDRDRFFNEFAVKNTYHVDFVNQVHEMARRSITSGETMIGQKSPAWDIVTAGRVGNS